MSWAHSPPFRGNLKNLIGKRLSHYITVRACSDKAYQSSKPCPIYIFGRIKWQLKSCHRFLVAELNLSMHNSWFRWMNGWLIESLSGRLNGWKDPMRGGEWQRMRFTL
jgi:hypothetical protein